MIYPAYHNDAESINQNINFNHNNKERKDDHRAAAAEEITTGLLVQLKINYDITEHNFRAMASKDVLQGNLKKKKIIYKQANRKTQEKQKIKVE